jgi:diguanylate cyclase (GGDEF)-like protein/PAS domain S-box-containing protein
MGTLPVRVTGIVFWGLIVIGLLVVLMMLNGRENQIIERQRAVVDRFMSDLYHEFALQPVSDTDKLANLVTTLAARSGSVKTVAIEIRGEVIRRGDASADLVNYTRPVWLTLDNESHWLMPVRVTLGLPSISQQVAAERKGLLLGMGGLFLLFGLILQRVLDRILTGPFQQMVNAARAFSSGNEQVRFDERRSDEFGYLGRFINQALDYSIEQKNALHSALDRAKRTEQELYKEKEKAVVTLRSIGDAVITTDRHGCVTYMNPVAEELIGWGFRDIRNTPLGKVMRLIDESSGKPLVNPVDLCLETGEKIVEEGHKILLRHDGREVAISDSAAPMRDPQGQLEGVVMVFHDVGHAHRLARQLSYQARHDPLTGLFNRREFEAQLNSLLESAQLQGRQHAVCYIDLDQFKVVNDVCGHGAGDELLRQLSGLLQRQVREADILARLGGDEFGVLLTHCNSEQALRIAENIRLAVRDFRFLYEDRSFEVGASIGVVAITRDSRSTSELMSAADIACYAAKDGGRNRVHLYQPSDEEVAERRGEMSWVAEIRGAIDQQRFYLLFQPIVPLAGSDRNRPSHYELLLRMQDSKGNEVLPMAFLPAAQRYSLMCEIDTWVVTTFMQILSGNRNIPERGIFLINLCGSSLTEPAFVELLEEQIRQCPLPAARICFEIDETSAISHLNTIGEAIKRLRALGCSFALDDFGSGLSSFGYLKDLDVDYIKIDGGFVKDIVQDEMDAAMVRAINEIGHIVGIKTIAEFIETGEIMERLAGIGVDYGQGHCIATPRPIGELFRDGQQPTLSLIK